MSNEYDYEDDEDDYEKKPNALSIWGNEKTMNLNSLLLTNVQSSHYFKVNLFGLKTYHEVIDEIYYNVGHMEPWEKGSRKAGQSGMCGGVRGVGTGGIVSTAFSCLSKLFTLRLTRKQVNGLLNHSDSPYIRGVGFLYLRYTQPPADLYVWFEPYLMDDEPIDVRAGGGEQVTMGQMCRRMLSKLDWYGTLLPRIPVPIEMKIQKMLKERFPPALPAPLRDPSSAGPRSGSSEHRGGDQGPRGPPPARSDYHRQQGSRSHQPLRNPAYYPNQDRRRTSPAREERWRGGAPGQDERRQRSRSRERRQRSRSRDRRAGGSREQENRRVAGSREHRRHRSGDRRRSRSGDRRPR